MKKGEKDKLTILINKEIKDKYREYCNSKGIILSRQVEFFMRNELEKIGKEEKNDKIKK